MIDIIARSMAGEALARQSLNGLVGNGLVDNGQIIRDAFALATGEAAAHATGDLVVADIAYWDIILPPGIFKFSNAIGRDGMVPTSGVQFRLLGAASNLTQILVPEDEYFIHSNIFHQGFLVTGIHFLGGRGVFRSDWVGESAGEAREWRDCRFTMFTECAISENSADTPFFRANGNTFAGAPGEPTMSIALSGAQDGMRVEHNRFLKGLIDIKLRRGGASGYIGFNDHTKFGGVAGNPAHSAKVANIWITPSTDGNHANLVIEGMKGGNENWEAGMKKILIADEDTTVATHNGGRNIHKTTLSTGYVTGLCIDKCLMGNGGYSYEGAGLIYSYTQNLADLKVDPVALNGAYPMNLIEYDPVVLASWTHTPRNTSSLLRIGPSQNAHSRVNNAANAPVGMVEDPLHLVQHQPWVPAYHHSGNDDGEIPLLDVASLYDSLTTAGTKNPLADRYGGSNAAEIRFGLATQNATLPLIQANLVKHRIGWVEFDIKRSVTDPLTAIQVSVQFSSPVSTIETHVYGIPSFWDRLGFPFFSPDASNPVRLTFAPIPWVSQRSGACTITFGYPAIFTWTSHGLAVGNKVRFTTTTTLPSTLAVGTEYFVTRVLTSSTFAISATEGGPEIEAIDGSTSGHTAVFVPPLNNGLYTWVGSPPPDGVPVQRAVFLGRPRVYLAKNRVNSEHIRTNGSMRWNGEHIVADNGRYHEWWDYTVGCKRVKTGGAPTTEADGVRLLTA